MWRLAFIAMLAGCFSKPGLHDRDSGVDDGRPIDGSVDVIVPDGACPAIYTNDLVAYYDFEEAGGDTADDGVPAQLEGTVSGATVTPGRTAMKSALDFQAQDAHVEVGSQTELNDLPQITVCAWVRLATQPTQIAATVAAKSFDGNVNGWDAYLNTAGAPATSFIAFYTPYHAYKLGVTPLEIGTWTHVCMAWNGTPGSDGITLFRNGANDGTNIEAQGQNTRDSDLGHKLVLGRATRLVQPNYPFLGDIDEVALYRRALAPTEVLAIYDCD
ncbi:MAG: LamG domain-containing protein [Kofleriaceae bacterium]